MKARLVAHGQNHPSPSLELFEQRRRDAVGGRRADDRIERSFLRPAKVPVPRSDEHVRIPQLFQTLSGSLCKGLDDLDGVDPSRDLAQTAA